MLLNPIRKEFNYGKQKVILETNRMARQANGSCLVTVGQTTVLAAVVGNPKAKLNQDFFPLTVNYIEKTYSVGKIPGGYLKREGRLSDKETLTARLIDRPLRPLFPAGFNNEVNVTLTVVSASSTENTDIAALIAASAALAISGLPFNGPVGAANVGYIDGEYVLNCDYETLKKSDLDMTVAGTDEAVLMVESEAKELSEEIMLGAVMFAHEQYQVVIEAIKKFAQSTAKPKWEFKPKPINETIYQAVESGYNNQITQLFQIKDKLERYASLSQLEEEIVSTLHAQFEQEFEATDLDLASEIKEAFDQVKKQNLRDTIINGGLRIDGRSPNQVREIEIEVGVLPHTHGSALFTRGETQALVTTTLGATRDAQMFDTLAGTKTDPFLFHYNFPSYCVGEVGRLGPPKRRELGHGQLARRGISAVLPDFAEFGYTTRVVSEILESNGSSSMASVCGASLSLMDAGVPLKAPVAGIAMGLIKQGNQYVVLTDIMGDEDHLGDMDFKVAGSSKGVTALQMDIKIQGITEEIMKIALSEAKQAKNHILSKMNAVLASSRNEISSNAPIKRRISINKDKIRDVIGKGGETIRALTEKTQSNIDIDNDGNITIFSPSKEKMDLALSQIKLITQEPEVGEIYKGKIEKIEEYGAFVEILPGKTGLLHISEVANERIRKVSDILNVGDEVEVKVLKIDRGRYSLSRRVLLNKS